MEDSNVDMVQPIDGGLPLERVEVLPMRIGPWTKVRNFLLSKMELTPKQQKIFREVRDFWCKEVTWRSFKEFWLQEVEITL